MAKEKTEEVLDIKTLRKTQFFGGEKERKEHRKNKPCPHRTKRVWDAEKQAYVKIKIYPKRTTFTRKEMKERFNTVQSKAAPVMKVEKQPTAPVVQAKASTVKPKVTHCYMRGLRLDWDKETLRYKVAA